MTKLANLTNSDIYYMLLEDEYYQYVAGGYIMEAIETAKKESKATTVEGLSKYIKAELI